MNLELQVFLHAKYFANAFVLLYLENYLMSVQYVEAEDSRNYIIYPCEQWHASNSLTIKIK